VSRPIESFRSFDDSMLLSATLICPNLPVKFRPAGSFELAGLLSFSV